MQSNTKPRLGDLANTIVTNRHAFISGNEGWEAYDSQFDGSYINYHVCPPGLTLETVDVDHLKAATVQMEHADGDCTIFAEMHF